MLIESVRVERNYRGQGIGKKFMEFAINRAKEKDCLFVQLTTSSDRTDAHFVRIVARRAKLPSKHHPDHGG